MKEKKEIKEQKLRQKIISKLAKMNQPSSFKSLVGVTLGISLIFGIFFINSSNAAVSYTIFNIFLRSQFS